MTQPSPETSHPTGFGRVAFVAALVVGLFGLYPHLRWSLETGGPAWFFNSYDEGYYGWLAVSELSLQRGLTDLVMHGLYLVSGSNAQLAMILADFFLPLGVTLACCYLVRPLFRTAGGMAAGALFILTSAECLALRSRLIPHTFLYDFLQEKVVPQAGGTAGLLQIDNQTSTFWLFRTPEPQVSWIIMFLTLGLALRLVLRPAGSPARWGWFVLGCLFAGFGYLFCTLGLGGALMLCGVLAARPHPRRALVVGLGGLLSVALCLGLSAYAARQSGGDSLVFPSHGPVVMLSVIIGLLAAGFTVAGCWRRKEFTPVHGFTLALGLTPLCLANQQVLTGRMIYLLNFENFSLAQLAALACLLALAPGLRSPAPETGPGLRWRRTFVPGMVILLLGGILGRSQWLSYRDYLDTNRLARSYALSLQQFPASGALVVCDDFFETDTLALLLGYRPEFLIARDMIFSKGIARLRDAQDTPPNGAKPRLALFNYLALTGVSPDELAERFSTITDPAHPGWQDRFLIGGFLYSHADFWLPFTHGRDAKLPWVAGQKNLVVNEYAQFLRHVEIGRPPVIFLMRQDKPTPAFLAAHGAQPLAGSPPAAPVPLKAYRIEAAH